MVEILSPADVLCRAKPPHFKLLVQVDSEMQSWNIDAVRRLWCSPLTGSRLLHTFASSPWFYALRGETTSSLR